MALVGLRVTTAEGQMSWVVKMQEKAEVKSEPQVEAEAEQQAGSSMLGAEPETGLSQDLEVEAEAEAEQEVVLLMVEGPLEVERVIPVQRQEYLLPVLLSMAPFRSSRCLR
jgi:hypothetical protein